MDDMVDELEIDKYKQIKTTDISKNLGIGESTVRKYAQLLEDKGYIFRRDLNGARIYTTADEVAINELKRLSKEGKMGVEMAAALVATRRKDENPNVAALQDVQVLQFNNNVIQDINNVMHDVRYMKENAVTKDQFNFLVQSVEKVLDSNTELMRKLDESNKHKEDAEKENAILKEKLDTAVEILQRLEEKPKGFFSRLLGK
ncbi:hypothetical protein AAGG74_23325 [Bacillus mexicanus]|uniref:hypothetical protein n=1 Tax=Bacillus mexicanus TaxID=2834415 RepID=UPI003D1EA9A7